MNQNIPTRDIEIEVIEITVLSEADELPFDKGRVQPRYLYQINTLLSE